MYIAKHFLLLDLYAGKQTKHNKNKKQTKQEGALAVTVVQIEAAFAFQGQELCRPPPGQPPCPLT